MTNLTPEIIESATDEQLSELVAVYCMGWFDCSVKGFYLFGNEAINKADWQPHLSTEKGKAQAIELAQKYGLLIAFDSIPEVIFNPHKLDGSVTSKSWQIAVLKACLYSVMGKE